MYWHKACFESGACYTLIDGFDTEEVAGVFFSDLL